MLKEKIVVPKKTKKDLERIIIEEYSVFRLTKTRKLLKHLNEKTSNFLWKLNLK